MLRLLGAGSSPLGTSLLVFFLKSVASVLPDHLSGKSLNFSGSGYRAVHNTIYRQESGGSRSRLTQVVVAHQSPEAAAEAAAGRVTPGKAAIATADADLVDLPAKVGDPNEVSR